MAEDSKIAWTDHTWNPWQGCRKVSPGCFNCYMYRDKKRYRQDASVVVRSRPTTFNKPLLWKGSAFVFVCSWSDFFIEDADEWRSDAWEIIKKTPHLTYLLLTKRPENIIDRLPEDWGEGYPNVWLGVTAENQKRANERIPILLQTPATKRFVSIEPMLGPVDLSLWIGCSMCGDLSESLTQCSSPDGDPLCEYCSIEVDGPYKGKNRLDWVICGGESGPDARPMKKEWAWLLMDQCTSAGVPFFYKQGPDDDGVFKQMPELTQIVWDQKPKP